MNMPFLKNFKFIRHDMNNYMALQLMKDSAIDTHQVKGMEHASGRGPYALFLLDKLEVNFHEQCTIFKL